MIAPGYALVLVWCALADAGKQSLACANADDQGIHGRDPDRSCGTLGEVINELPDPVLTQVYCLKAVTGPPLEYGNSPTGHRRVVPLVGGMFTGPELNGNLLPGGSASWHMDLPDGTAFVEVRYTLQTDSGALLYIRSSGAGQGDPDRDQYLVHAATHIETAAPKFDWLNNSVFVTVAGRTAVNMLYETYLVG